MSVVLHLSCDILQQDSGISFEYILNQSVYPRLPQQCSYNNQLIKLLKYTMIYNDMLQLLQYYIQ